MAVLRPPKKSNNFSSSEWRCLYCGNINRLVDQSCSGCGAQRNFILNENTEEIENDIIFVSGTYKAQNPFQVYASTGTVKGYGISVPYSKQKDLVLPSGTCLSFDVPLSEEEYKEFASFVANNYKFYSNDEMREIFWRHFGR